MNWWAITFLGVLIVGALTSIGIKSAEPFSEASGIAFIIGIVWLFIKGCN